MSISERHQVTTDIQIRPFVSDDYDAVVRIANATFPDAPGTVAEWRFEDEHWDSAKYFRQRFVACPQTSGQILGYCGVWHIPWNFHPQKYSVNIRVHPDARQRGVGARLWEHLVEVLRTRDAIVARTQVRENMPEGVFFALRRGFSEVMRVWESRLDVGACDLTRYQAHVDRVAASGVTITTLAAERARDPDCLQRLYALHNAIGEDIPQPDRFTPPDFKLFLSYVVESPHALPDAHFIAVAGGEYVGVSNLAKPELGDWLIQNVTGATRAYRGRSIATALKVRTVEYAKAHGVREIRTWNEIKNVGILAINARMGFVRQPAWVTYMKEFPAA